MVARQNRRARTPEEGKAGRRSMPAIITASQIAAQTRSKKQS
jgi:hypothetical protein